MNRLIVATLLMCLALIHASAMMHLTNIGMGNPDWPASYGIITDSETGQTGQVHTMITAITPTTIADRIHRAIANILELLIIAVVFVTFMQRKSSARQPKSPILIPILALILSLILAFLGAWYGSPLRYPWIMIINLTGGMILLALFWWLTLNIYSKPRLPADMVQQLRPWAIAGAFLVLIQIISGAWTDAYYAALACGGLPDCAETHWSLSDLLRGFGLLNHLDIDTSGKIITDQAVAAAIHMMHRTLALITFLYIGILAWKTLVMGGSMRAIGSILLCLLIAQLILGMMMTLLSMPLIFVVAHTVTASLLLLAMLSLIHQTEPQK